MRGSYRLFEQKMNFLTGNEKRFFDFFTDMNEKDKIALISHTDLDGIASALEILKIIGKADYLEFIDYSENMLEKVIPEIKRRKINKVIFSDISIDSNTKGIEEIKKLGKILVIDHHKFDTDLNSEKIIYIKTESKVPPSYVCYSLLSRIQNLEKIDWIAASAVLADWCYEKNNEFVDKIMKKYDLDGRKNNQESIRETKLWGISCSLSLFLIYFKDDMQKAFNILGKTELKSLDEIYKYASSVEKEIDELSKTFYEKRDIENYGYYWNFRPKFKIKSYLINKLSSAEENKLFVFATREKNCLRVSLRRQDGKIDCDSTGKKAAEGLKNATIGGHKAAAGGEIMPEDEGIFKQNLRELFG